LDPATAAWTIALYVIGIGLVLLGLVGQILPVIPGAPLTFLGIVLVAWADGFERIGAWGIGVAAVLTVLVLLADYVAGLVGAKRFGASRWGLIGAVIGTVVGLFFGLPGVVLGPIVGAVVLEYAKDPDFKRAGRVGIGTLVGFVLGTAVKYALTMLMIGVVLVDYLF
jgi:uncharacterized protein YqgC (DUF456 family)